MLKARKRLYDPTHQAVPDIRIARPGLLRSIAVLNRKRLRSELHVATLEIVSRC